MCRHRDLLTDTLKFVLMVFLMLVFTALSIYAYQEFDTSYARGDTVFVVTPRESGHGISIFVWWYAALCFFSGMVGIHIAMSNGAKARGILTFDGLVAFSKQKFVVLSQSFLALVIAFSGYYFGGQQLLIQFFPGFEDQGLYFQMNPIVTALMGYFIYSRLNQRKNIIDDPLNLNGGKNVSQSGDEKETTVSTTET